MKHVKDITICYEISKALNELFDLRKSLYRVLDILSTQGEFERGTITILNPMTDEIRIEVAHGLTRTAMEKGKYKIGEGVTGKVIQTGKPFAVPKISDEPLFLNKTASRSGKNEHEYSFICVPIKKENR